MLLKNQHINTHRQEDVSIGKQPGQSKCMLSLQGFCLVSQVQSSEASGPQGTGSPSCHWHTALAQPSWSSALRV
jgi:hypothetical protein